MAMNKKSASEMYKYCGGAAENIRSFAVDVGENSFDVEIKTTIGLQDSIDFVKAVVNTVFQSDGKYYAALEEFAIRHATIMFYTNIALPSDPDEEFDFLFGSDIYDKVVSYISKNEYQALCDAAEEQIAYKIDMSISAAEISTQKAIDELRNLMNRYEVFMETVQKFAGADVFAAARKIKDAAPVLDKAVAEIRAATSEE